MKRNIPGLSATASRAAIPDGLYLLRVESALYCWGTRKQFYSLRFSILEPKTFAGREITSRLHCTPRATWKLGWFLRDFLYDPELLSEDDIDERVLCGLVGVAKIRHTVIDGASLANLEAFAPASQWAELSGADVPSAADASGAGKERSE